MAFFQSWKKQTIIRLTSAGPDLRACLHLKVTLLQFFRDSVARATIACQTSVLIARAKMTPVNLRINENIFSTWKAFYHFNIRSNSLKVLSNLCSGLRPITNDRKVHKQPVKEIRFFARDAWLHMSASKNEGHAQFNSFEEYCSKIYRTTHDEIFTVDFYRLIAFRA